jgi:hypothetical protein
MRRFLLLLTLMAAYAAMVAPGTAGAQSMLPTRPEIEPNNAFFAPDPIPVVSDMAIRGSINPVGDRDFFRVVVTQTTSIRFETFVPDVPVCTTQPFPLSNDTVIRLWDVFGNQIALDDQSGISNCSLLVRTLNPGTYFISVEEFVNNNVILAYTLEIDFTALAATVVTLDPIVDENPVGTSHTVTATARSPFGPTPGVTIIFTVMGASDAQGSCTTNAQGQCSFTYTGPELPGADMITGCADNNSNAMVDPGEPCGEALKIWVLPATTPGQVTGGGWILNGTDKVSFGFNAQSDGTDVKGNCNVIDHATKLHIKCLTVESLVVAGTHATFFGQAKVGDTTTDYRIDVDDLGEPGTADTFRIQTGSGYTAGGTLAGGNIQIHR